MVENKTVMKAAVAKADAALLQVNSLLLPVTGAVLLVPQLAVAEVLSSGDLEAGDLRLDETSVSPHYYGWVRWRDQDVPLLSFDSLYSGHRPSLDEDLKVVICNAVFKAAASGFYALVVSGFPRATRLSMESEMVLEGSPSDQKGVQMRVNIDGEEVLIPDFDLIEEIVFDIVDKKDKSS
ncbi:MAG: chemotaxis protein CheW [Candidatus Reddybacter sp.]